MHMEELQEERFHFQYALCFEKPQTFFSKDWWQVYVSFRFLKIDELPCTSLKIDAKGSSAKVIQVLGWSFPCGSN